MDDKPQLRICSWAARPTAAYCEVSWVEFTATITCPYLKKVHWNQRKINTSKKSVVWWLASCVVVFLGGFWGAKVGLSWKKSNENLLLQVCLFFMSKDNSFFFFPQEKKEKIKNLKRNKWTYFSPPPKWPFWNKHKPCQYNFKNRY